VNQETNLRRRRRLPEYEITVTVTSVQHWKVKAEDESEAGRNYDSGEMMDEDKLVEVTEVNKSS